MTGWDWSHEEAAGTSLTQTTLVTPGLPTGAGTESQETQNAGVGKLGWAQVLMEDTVGMRNPEVENLQVSFWEM